MRTRLPSQGTPWEELRQQMQASRQGDVDWRSGRASVYVFHPGDDVLDVAHDAYGDFISENGLGPAAFPSLRQMERDVVDMALGLQAAPDDAEGSMTSGGTESIVMALKACRDHARANGCSAAVPEVVAPQSAHPAFDKGAHLLGLRVVRVPVRDFLADVDAMADAVTDATIMLVGSAPSFPYGLIDPIPKLAELARSRDLWLHVDACVGGYVAPFVRMAGHPVDPYDFSIDGVSSMSADLHKYGYAAKGASTVLYRDRSLYAHQVFEFDDWPCGHMSTPTLAGTRPGGAIAGAWAVMNYLGEVGYAERADRIVQTRKRLEDGVRALGFEVFGAPQVSLLAFGGDGLDVKGIGRALYSKGWMSSRTTEPKGIHLMISPQHADSVDDYLVDLAELVKASKAGKLGNGGRDIAYSS